VNGKGPLAGLKLCQNREDIPRGSGSSLKKKGRGGTIKIILIGHSQVSKTGRFAPFRHYFTSEIALEGE
jgi:hypothetical protein